MPDVLLFGATGYTGQLTAHALARRGASFAICGRNQAKLESLSEQTGRPEVRVARVGDVRALTRALDDVRALITCVGPFLELGETAVEAALRARVHYIDSSGEGPFIARLIGQRHEQARAAGIGMAPAMAFDEVPADVAATLATDGLNDAELVLTYAVPTVASAGTVRSSIKIVTSAGPWIVNGQQISIRAGEEQRWAPMPRPLGPRLSVSVPLAELHLAPLHLQLRSLRLFATVGPMQRLGLRAGVPALHAAMAVGPLRRALEAVITLVVRDPDETTRARGRWTILAEARSGEEWRNVAITGADVYGLSAELLATAAVHMAQDDYAGTGVLAPVQAVDVDVLHKELLNHGASIETFEPS